MISHTAVLLLAFTISSSIPSIATRNAVSASASDWFLASTQPSHHRVVAGLPPLIAAGAAAMMILPATWLSLGSFSEPAREAHRFAMAILPCMNCRATKVESEVRISGSM